MVGNGGGRFGLEVEVKFLLFVAVGLYILIPCHAVFADTCGICDNYPPSSAHPYGQRDYIAGDGMINLADFANFALKWGMAGCDVDDWCEGADVTFDSFVDSNDLYALSNCWLARDDKAPGHDPLVWAEEPNSISVYADGPPYMIRMSVEPAYDDWTGEEVEYYFCTDENQYYDVDETVVGESNWMTDPSYDENNWQAENAFVDAIFTPITPPAFPSRNYVVRARERRADGVYNITAGSVARGAQFGVEQNPPDDGQWAIGGSPALSGPTSVSMTAMTAVDYDINGDPYVSDTYDGVNKRVVYIFTRKRNGFTEMMVTRDDPTWTDTGLLADERYEYTVRTRDMPYGNYGGVSASVFVTVGGVDNAPPTPNPAMIVSASRQYTGAFYDFVTAVTATDAEGNGVWYQFEIDSVAQPWQQSKSLQNMVAQIGTHTYRVRYRDNFSNTTGWSQTVSVNWSGGGV